MQKFKTLFELTNKYIILATPLILFSLFSNVYAIFSVSGRLINILFAMILLTLMSSAFLAGWFNMVKNAVDNKHTTNPNLLIKDFIPGVGEFFLPTLGGLIFLSLFSILLLILAFIFGNHTIGDIGVTATQLSNAMLSQEALKEFLTSLTPEQIIKINKWNILLLLTMAGTYFVQIFYFPAIFYKNRNPFIAMFIGFKDLFSRKFFKTLLISVIILITYLFLSTLLALSGKSIILHFIATLLNFYFLIILSVGIFYYYNTHFVNSNIGQNIDVKI